MAWKGVFNFRKKFTVSHPDGALTNYPIKIIVGQSAESVGCDIHCDKKVSHNFADVRFCSSDGETYIDHYLESVSGTHPNRVAVFWVECPTIGTSDTDFYMYYGNRDGTSMSSSANTGDTCGDTFERGANGANIATGGAWTILQGSCVISTEQYKVGYRSCKLVGSGTPGQCNIPCTAATGKVIRFWAYKPNTSGFTFAHGDGVHRIWMKWDTDEGIYFVNSVEAYGSNLGTVTADAWHLFEFKNIDWSVPTFDIYVDEVFLATVTDIGHYASAEINKIWMANGLTDGTHCWFDNLFVYTPQAVLPTITNIYDEEITPWLDGWSYRKAVAITASSSQTDYPIRLFIHLNLGDITGVTRNIWVNNHVKPDFTDLRFTSVDGTTLLDHWIQGVFGTWPAMYAIVWVECPTLSTTATTIYMYYGNPDATDTSNGSNVFSFFDDFASETLDSSKWTTVQGTPDFSSGTLKLTGTSGTRGLFASKITFAEHSAIGVRLKTEANQLFSDNQIGFYKTASVAGLALESVRFYGNGSANGITFNTMKDDGYSNQAQDCSVTDLATYQYYNMQWDVSNCKFYEGDDLKLTNSNYTYTTAKYLCLYEGSNTARNVTLDWIFVRKFDPTAEPTQSWSLYGSEDTARDYYPNAIPNYPKRGRSRLPGRMRWTGRRLSRLANQIEIDPPYDQWWSGQIITVGLGKDFYSIPEAIGFASNGAMILVDPGHHTNAYRNNWNSAPWCERDYILRGVGSGPWDTVIDIDDTYGTIGDQGWYHAGNTRIFWENIRFRMNSTRWFQQLELYSAGQITHMNKVVFNPSYTTIYGLCGQSAWNADSNGELLLRNCYISKGYSHFASTDLTKVRLIKCQLDTTLSGGSGALAENDHVTSATLDYGPNYGKLFIRGLTDDINNATL
jgi:hypothetical protein